MKQLTIIISSILFSTLFYQQNLGLNLSVFSVFTIVVLAINNTKAFKNKTTLLYTSIYFITAVLVFYQHTYLSIITNCIAFFTVIGKITESKSSLFVSWLNGLFSSIGGWYHRNVDFDDTKGQPKLKKDIDVWHWTKLIGIPIVFIVVFILLYKNGNSVFNDLISQISFSFINLQWILFSILGYFLFSNIINPIQVETTTQADLNTGNTLVKTENASAEALKKETQLGTTLMVFLNILIVFYVITDLIALNSKNLYTAAGLSNNVHNGINALIASIVIAIAIILYFFRGNLNFYKDNNTIKNLSYGWIFLNAILVILIAIKNHEYVSAFGFTYKRIGVYVYLLLTFIGLVTTFLKVYSIKNLLFLFRVNTQIAFVILLLGSTINWDNEITKYNINYAQNLDLDYLINLSNNNAELLNAYSKTKVLDATQHRKIDYKYQDYVQLVTNRNWQEYTFANYTISNIQKENY
ncbi:DUF4153 domain-containing protein [Lacinutrix salivirga]